MSEIKEYHGNCHCGLFKFTVKTPELSSLSVWSCDCSICIRNGYIWIHPITDENFAVESGEGALSTYEFGKKNLSHFFCPQCGSSVMGRRKSKQAGDAFPINARMLKDVDFEALEKKVFPGKTMGSAYEPPTFPPPSLLGEIEEGMKIYNGNCHCGAVTYTVKTKPLTEQKVMHCNCSLCSRNGDHYIYPPKTSVALQGAENLTEYAFLNEQSLHCFCKICGVSVLVKASALGDDAMPLNVRTIDGIELDKLTYKTYDGRSQPPLYAVRR